VLDISALTSPQPKASQHLALQLVKMAAQRVEDAGFLRRFGQEWVLRLSSAPQFLEVSPEYLLALDASGHVAGYNRRAQLLLETPGAPPLLGRHIEQLLQLDTNHLGRYLKTEPADRRAVVVNGSRRILFLLAAPPPARQAQAVQAAQARQIPAPLAALSGGDALLDRQIERAAKLVNTPVSLLLTGETGTGKEYFAKALHESSERRRGPFIAVNCAAIPETLIESELFGHVRGAFTGAEATRAGLFGAADGGTLFLDEVGDATPALQLALLRVLEEGSITPVGADRGRRVSVRVISATNQDLPALVREHRFRRDLYYRLNVFSLRLPPLRERVDEVVPLARYFLRHASQRLGRPPLVLSEEARGALEAHLWEGNVRELRSVMERTALVCKGRAVGAADLSLASTGSARPSSGESPATGGTLREIERQVLQKTLALADGNQSQAARILGLHESTLRFRLRRAGIVAVRRATAS
jgi:transcriptional regulator with PAS, ATPase and Fis domain